MHGVGWKHSPLGPVVRNLTSDIAQRRVELASADSTDERENAMGRNAVEEEITARVKAAADKHYGAEVKDLQRQVAELQSWQDEAQSYVRFVTRHFDNRGGGRLHPQEWYRQYLQDQWKAQQ